MKELLWKLLLRLIGGRDMSRPQPWGEGRRYSVEQSRGMRLVSGRPPTTEEINAVLELAIGNVCDEATQDAIEREYQRLMRERGFY